MSEIILKNLFLEINCAIFFKRTDTHTFRCPLNITHPYALIKSYTIKLLSVALLSFCFC